MTYRITDGGIETALTERLGQDLPEFSAFVLLDTDEGRRALIDYYRPFVEVADESGLPLVLDTPTWRANALWGRLLGYDAEGLDRINHEAVALVRSVVAEVDPSTEVIVNGCVGPKFDDYVAEDRMSADDAETYHLPQVHSLAAAGADRITAVTVLDVAEAVGVVRAAVSVGIDVYVSFTVADDGLLSDGTELSDAIAQVDAATDGAAEAFLINCAHPTEAESAFAKRPGAAQFARVHGFRLNAARQNDEGAGDRPEVFAKALFNLHEIVPSSRIFGGCCGTDTPHIRALAGEMAGAGVSAA